MKALLAMLALVATPVAAQVVPSPSLGTAEGRCRPGEAGPAFFITLLGMKDRAGRVKVEVYPSNDTDFLADDAVLINAHKTFRRVELQVPATGLVQLCVRVPAPGAYSMSLLHDRDSNRKFGLSVDGVGFPGNPSLGWSKPKAAVARAVAGPGITNISVKMQYRRGLFSFGPL